MKAQVEIKIIKANGIEVYACLVNGVEITRAMSEQGCRLQVLKLFNKIKVEQAAKKAEAELTELKAKIDNKKQVKQLTYVA